MHRTLAFALFALALAACDSPSTDGDAGTADAGPPDTGTPSEPDSGFWDDLDAGTPIPTCTEGCEFVELALGAEHSCARRANGEVWCWGRNEEGELGDGRMRHQDCSNPGNPEVDCSGEPVQVRAATTGVGEPIRDAVQLSSQGTFSTCAVRESGGVWCWGEQGTPVIGGGMPELRFRAVPLAGLGEATQVANGHHHVCGLMPNGQAICFGHNGSGQVGLGHKESVPAAGAPVLDSDGEAPLAGVVQIVAAGFRATTCARTDSAVFCWGTNLGGQLGDGLATHEQCGATITERHDCRGLPVMVGEAESPLPPGTHLAVGRGHVCVLGATAEGSLHCWGDNQGAQVGAGSDAETVNLPYEVTALADVLDDGEEVVEIALGGRFTCARTSAGNVWCWGYNFYGQLGDGVMDHGAPGGADNCTPGSSETGDCSHAPVQVQGIDDATAIGAGGSHACAIRESGQIWCWGANDARQLGDGTREPRFAPVRVLRLP